MRNQAEFRLQCAVVQHLRLAATPGTHWFAVPNGEARSPRTGARLKAMGVRAGEPDLIIIRDGMAYGLELKAAKGRMSPEQRTVCQEWDDAGAEYRTATGIDAALAALVAWGALPTGYAFTPRKSE